MLVFDGSCSSWFSILNNNDIPSLRWRISLSALPKKFAEQSKGMPYLMFFSMLFRLCVVLEIMSKLLARYSSNTIK